MADGTSEVPLESAPPVAAPPPRRFSLVVTVFCSIVVALYIGLLGRPLIEPRVSPLAELDRPADSLDRLITRELDLRAAMRGGLRWEWRLYRALSGDEDPVAEATGWFEEVLDADPSPAAELSHAVLLGESGRTEKASEEISRWDADSDVDQRMARWVSAAYLGPPPAAEAGRAMITEISTQRPSNWFTNTLVKRIAARIGDTGARARAEAAILARGRALLFRARLLMAVSLALVLLGVAAGVWMLARRPPGPIADAPLPPIWTGGEGYALFVRALGAPQAIALAAFVILRRETGLGSLIGMAADLPLFLWVIGYLRARGSSMRDAMGLWPDRRRWSTLAAVWLVLVAVALLGDALIELASGYLRLKTHWTDGFTEELLWSSRRRVFLESFDASVWAPIVEEITFRGLLYGTLRTRLAMWPAALLSAAIFTLPHGYALAGSASVFLSGILWAVAYERTRSVLPGLLAHSANNALSTAWTLAMLR